MLRSSLHGFGAFSGTETCSALEIKAETPACGRCRLLKEYVAVDRKVLLLDEHTAALDPRSGDQVIGLTDTIVRRDKLTTLMVTHSMQQAADLGDRLIMMHRGRIIQDFQGAKRSELAWTI